VQIAHSGVRLFATIIADNTIDSAAKSAIPWRQDMQFISNHKISRHTNLPKRNICLFYFLLYTQSV
jgi:hypothetical protein